MKKVQNGQQLAFHKILLRLRLKTLHDSILQINEKIMKIIGLTGSVASGKILLLKFFTQLGCSVFDADFQVHQLIKMIWK